MESKQLLNNTRIEGLVSGLDVYFSAFRERRALDVGPQGKQDITVTAHFTNTSQPVAL